MFIDRELLNLPNFLLVGFVIVLLIVSAHLIDRAISSSSNEG